MSEGHYIGLELKELTKKRWAKAAGVKWENLVSEDEVVSDKAYTKLQKWAIKNLNAIAKEVA